MRFIKGVIASAFYLFTDYLTNYFLPLCFFNLWAKCLVRQLYVADGLSRCGVFMTVYVIPFCLSGRLLYARLKGLRTLLLCRHIRPVLPDT